MAKKVTKQKTRGVTKGNTATDPDLNIAKIAAEVLNNPLFLKELAAIVAANSDDTTDKTDKTKSKNPLRGMRSALKTCVQPAKSERAIKNETGNATREREMRQGFKVRTEGESLKGDAHRRKRNGT